MNVADLRSPLILMHFEGPDGKTRMDIPAPELPMVGKWRELLAKDPVGHALFYREMMSIFLEVVCGCAAGGEMSLDGSA